MTLVIARKKCGQVGFLSDCLISGGVAELREPELALKLFALSPNRLVAYSGSPEIAHSLIRDSVRQELDTSQPFYELLQQNWTNIAERNNGCTTDFIFVERDVICVLKDGCLDVDASAGWLGDQTAFSKFQETFSNVSAKLSGENTFNEWFSSMQCAMDAICADSDFETISGPVVAATSNKDVSKYVCRMLLVSPRYMLNPNPNPSPNTGWQTVDFGDAAKGGYSFTTITPVEPGDCGWGIFYFQAFSGLFFSVNRETFEFVKFTVHAKSAKEFCNLLSQEIGYELDYCGRLG